MINGLLERKTPKPASPAWLIWVAWEKALTLTGLLLLAFPLLGLAQQVGMRVEKTIDATPTPRISLTNLNGRVVVRGWDKLQIHIVSTPSTPLVSVEMEIIPSGGPAEKLRLNTEAHNGTVSAKEASTDYFLEVPLASSLDLRDFEGNIQVQRLQGDVGIESGGAPVEVDDVSGHLAVRSLNGDIRISRAAGRVEANSVCGSLYFISPSGTDLRAVTTSGKIVLEGDFVPAADYQLATWSGNMDVYTSPGGYYDLVAKSVKGKVVRDPETLQSRPRRARRYPGSSAFSATGSGEATLELKSFSGIIRINPMHHDSDGR